MDTEPPAHCATAKLTGVRLRLGTEVHTPPVAVGSTYSVAGYGDVSPPEPRLCASTPEMVLG